MTDSEASIRERVVALLEQVPREPGTALPRGATEEELHTFEQSTGLRLPAEFAEWLRICNGPCIGPGGIYGISPAQEFLQIESLFALYPEWKNKGWFPVAGDGTGNHYILTDQIGNDAHHPIFFVDHEADIDIPAYIVASNLWLFLWFLLQSELDWIQTRTLHWPCSKQFVLEIDPAIAQYEGILPLP